MYYVSGLSLPEGRPDSTEALLKDLDPTRFFLYYSSLVATVGFTPYEYDGDQKHWTPITEGHDIFSVGCVVGELLLGRNICVDYNVQCINLSGDKRRAHPNCKRIYEGKGNRYGRPSR